MDDDFSLCLVLNTRMAARAVTRQADRRLRPFAVTAAQFSVLTSMQSRPGRSVTELAQSIAMERSTLSRNLDLLEKKGLVAGHAEPHGGGRVAALTPAGTALIEQIAPVWRAAQADWANLLHNPDFSTVVRSLRSLAQA